MRTGWTKKGGTNLFHSKHGIALVMAAALLFLAVPRLPVSMESGLPSVFAYAWLAFAHLVIAANWRMVLQVDREVKRKDERARRMRWLKAQKQKRVATWSFGDRKRWQRGS